MSEAVDVHEELDQLRERVAELEATVEELQDSGEKTSSGGFGDWRDQAVLAELESGDRLSVRDLKSLYRTKADIANARTAKDRIKSLTSDGPFETVAHATWRYTGGEDSE